MASNIEFFIALEMSVWQALVTGDAKSDTDLLTADFLGVYPSGFAGRADHAGQLDQGPVMQEFHLDQARLLEITRTTYCLVIGPHTGVSADCRR